MEAGLRAEGADIFIRHGDFKKPKWPTYKNFKKFIADTSLPLTLKGRKQIEDSIEQIHDMQLVDTILSSPYARTTESARIVQEYLKERHGLNVSIQTTDLLKEIDVGPDILSCKEFYTLIVKNLGKLELLKEAVFDKWRLGEAKEKPEEVRIRIRELLKKVDQFHKEGRKRLLMVSHASLGRAFMRFLRGRDITLPREADTPLTKAEIFYIFPSKSISLLK